jgi:sugar phosphate isomerase/epimerase
MPIGPEVYHYVRRLIPDWCKSLIEPGEPIEEQYFLSAFLEVRELRKEVISVTNTSRREFLKTGVVSLLPFALSAKTVRPQAHAEKLSVCLFSKPLQALDCSELAEFCATLGIPGVDLTVRPQGHVLPERVTKDLPAAVETLRSAGVQVPMITTAIVDPGEAATLPIIQTAGDLGIPHLKLGYYYYQQFEDIAGQLIQTRSKVRAIGAICEKHKVRAGFHNHSGAYVGAALWDVHEVLQGIPDTWVGAYFDPAHATIEGGDAGWKIGMNLLLSRITMVAVKDFRWLRIPGKRHSEAEFGPLGVGEVRWDEFFAFLKKANFSGPVSLHVEFTAAKDNSRAERERLRRLVGHDFNFLRQALEKSGMG